MSEQGTVTSVESRIIGSELTAAVASGATALPVVYGFEFPERGGQVFVDGDVLTYASITESVELNEDADQADTIVLSAPTTKAYEAGTRVEVYPRATEKFASVQLSSADDAIEARVPHSLDALLAEGIRQAGEGESVTVEVNGSGYVLVDVVGKVASIDASRLDPATTIPAAALTDGLPPANSPAPTLSPLGIGALSVNWPAVPNHDLVTYRVYIDNASPVTLDEAHLATETKSLSTSISALPDGTPIAYGTDYYVVVQALDADGAADPSAPSGPAQARQATGPDVAASYVYAGVVSAGQIETGTLRSVVTISGTVQTATDGARSAMDGDGFKVFGPDGEIQVYFPNDPMLPNSFSGKVEADSLEVDASAVFNANVEIGKNAVARILSGTVSPKTGPTVVLDYYTVTIPSTAVDADFADERRGLVRHSGKWWWTVGYYVSSGPRTALISMTDAGVTTVEDYLSDYYPVGLGVTAIGNDLFWSGQYLDGSGKITKWYVRRYTPSTGALGLGLSGTGAIDGTTCWGTDGTNLIRSTYSTSTTAPTQRITLTKYNPDASYANVGSPVTFSSGSPQPIALLTGNFDFGSARTITVSAGNSYFYPYTVSGTTYTYQNAEAFLTNGAPQGACWTDDTAVGTTPAFWSLSGSKISRYTQNTWTTESAQWWAGYTWYRSSPFYETTISPKTGFTMRKRARVNITPSAWPGNGTDADDPTHFDVYFGRGATEPTNANMDGQNLIWTRPASNAVITARRESIRFGTTDAPPTVNSFPASVGGSLRSDQGGFLVRGDGSGSSGLITTPVIATAIPFATGYASYSATGGAYGGASVEIDWITQRVHLDGLVQRSGATTAAATTFDIGVLPTGYIPAVAKRRPVTCLIGGQRTAEIYIEGATATSAPAGTIRVLMFASVAWTSGGGNFLSLSGISFRPGRD